MSSFQRSGLPLFESFFAIAWMALFLGCSGNSITDNTIHQEMFCDGQSVSMIVTQEHTVWRTTYSTHAGRYQQSVRHDSWLVSWPLEKLVPGVGVAAAISYLGRFEANYRERSQAKPGKGGNLISQSGYSSPGFTPFGVSNAALHRGEQLRVLENGTERRSDSQVIFDSPRSGSSWSHYPEIAPAAYTFSRSRKHVFSWRPSPAIFTIPEMKVVWSAKDTESFKSFEKLYRAAIDSKLFLSDDLSSLIVVENANDKHTDTYTTCYDLGKDAVFKKIISDSEILKTATIVDVENTKVGMQWLVAMNLKDWGWNENMLNLRVIDSDLNILHQVDVPPRITRDGMTTHFSWDANAARLWTFALPGDQSTEKQIDVAYGRISATCHDLQSAQDVSFPLKLAPLKTAL